MLWPGFPCLSGLSEYHIRFCLSSLFFIFSQTVRWKKYFLKLAFAFAHMDFYCTTSQPACQALFSFLFCALAQESLSRLTFFAFAFLWRPRLIRGARLYYHTPYPLVNTFFHLFPYFFPILAFFSIITSSNRGDRGSYPYLPYIYIKLQLYSGMPYNLHYRYS